MVGLTWSAIVLAVVSRSEELGKRCIGVKYPSAIAPSFRAITYIGFVNSYFYKSEESFYFLQLLGADNGQMLRSVFIDSTTVNTPLYRPVMLLRILSP